VEDIIHAGGRFIAVGGGVKVSPTKIARVWTSKNGKRWQSVPLAGTARRGIMRAVARTSDGFVAVGQGPCIMACSAVWRSPDGTTWQRLGNAPVFADSVMRGVVVHKGRLIAIGCRNVGFHCADGRVWASDDGGRTWEQLGDVPGLNFNAVAVVDGLLVGAGDCHGFDELGQPTFGTSPDGVDWRVHVPDETDDIGRMLAAGRQGVTALVAGGGHGYAEGSPRFTSAILRAGMGGDLEPVETRVFDLGRFGDIAVHKDLVLLGGSHEGRRPLMPYSVWTTDLTTFKRVRFPKASERLGGIVYAVAISRNGARAVAGGDDANSRAVMWFSRVVRQ
jgi:hypothetical protein